MTSITSSNDRARRPVAARAARETDFSFTFRASAAPPDTSRVPRPTIWHGIFMDNLGAAWLRIRQSPAAKRYVDELVRDRVRISVLDDQRFQERYGAGVAAVWNHGGITLRLGTLIFDALAASYLVHESVHHYDSDHNVFEACSRRAFLTRQRLGIPTPRTQINSSTERNFASEAHAFHVQGAFDREQDISLGWFDDSTVWRGTLQKIRALPFYIRYLGDPSRARPDTNCR